MVGGIARGAKQSPGIGGSGTDSPAAVGRRKLGARCMTPRRDFQKSASVIHSPEGFTTADFRDQDSVPRGQAMIHCIAYAAGGFVLCTGLLALAHRWFGVLGSVGNNEPGGRHPG